MKIKIRKEKDEDLDQIIKLFIKVLPVTYENKEVGITKEDVINFINIRFDKIKLNNKIKTSHIKEDLNKINLVAIDTSDNEKIIGLCRASRKSDINELLAIYVDPEYQNIGIGKTFWGECLKFFDKNNPTIVRLATYNKEAFNFYKKLGFVDSGKRLTEERNRMPSGIYIPEMEMKKTPHD